MEEQMNGFSVGRRVVLVMVGLVPLAGCEVNSTGLASDGGVGHEAGVPSTGAPSASSPDAARATPAPAFKPGVDPAIFLPQLVIGYQPTAQELATSGKACVSDADCATTGGLVVFHCSTPYYGHAQCQGAFPPGDKVVPGVAPSCAYYDCPAGYQCATDAKSHSVTCLSAQ